MAYDILIRGGRIYDGSGMPSYLGDVAVAGGRIVETGRVSGSARRVIDAAGLAVAPGFIDFHTHLDAQLLWDPIATSSCWHGITTVIPGNCGLTLAPARPEDRENILDSFARVEAMPIGVLRSAIQWEWETFPEYLDRLDGGLGVNVAALVGHCALRHYVMGDAACERAATQEEIDRMKAILRDSVAGGALGFSTNRNPVHMRTDGRPIASRLASGDELLQLAGVLGELNRGAIQISVGTPGISMPANEAVGLFDRLASQGRPVIWQSISHRWDQPDLWRDLLEMGRRSLEAGYPSYPLCNARLFNNRFNLRNAQVFDDLPTWKQVLFTPLEQRKEILRDPEVRRKLRYEAVENHFRSRFSRRWDLVYLIRAATPKNKPLEKKSVAEIARIQGKEVLDAFLDLSLEEDLETLFQTSSNNGDESAVAEILRSPITLVGQSDAGAHLVYDAGWGYATRFLGYWVRERKIMPLEEAVRKLTFMVASIFGLEDRGMIRPGLAADIVVFDPETVGDSEPEMVDDLPGGERRLVQKATGIEVTIVNGQALVERGRYTGALPGAVLRRGSGEAFQAAA
ncbi:MAG TPA: amidohydrolase family protein [candidate division Zixibacteria bacterium]|nr:amidohydrolase family protein [candidate division Zixibacteria bacterium]